MTTKLLCIFVLFMALIATVAWSAFHKLSSPPIIVIGTCPTESTFTEFWNAWSYQYLTDNPDADIDMQMEDWNTLVVLNDCGDEWLDPLDEIIKEYSASSTPVYWYDTP